MNKQIEIDKKKVALIRTFFKIIVERTQESECIEFLGFLNNFFTMQTGSQIFLRIIGRNGDKIRGLSNDEEG